MFHGRLLAAGVEGGVDNLDTYDAVCLVIAELYRLAEATGFTYDPDRVKNLRELLALGADRPDDAIAEADAMRAEMERLTEPDEAEAEERRRKLREVADQWGAQSESSGA